MKNKILWITRTAVMLALLVVVQYVTSFIPKPVQQYVTGSCVNAVLAVAVLMSGFWSGTAVAVVSPFVAFLFGIGPQLLPIVPAIAAGNLEDKTLISYYSTACVSGKLLFNSACRIIFTYPLAGDSFNEKCDYEDYFQKLSGLYDNVHIARTKDELFSLLDQ